MQTRFKVLVGLFATLFIGTLLIISTNSKETYKSFSDTESIYERKCKAMYALAKTNTDSMLVHMWTPSSGSGVVSNMHTMTGYRDCYEAIILH